MLVVVVVPASFYMCCRAPPVLFSPGTPLCFLEFQVLQLPGRDEGHHRDGTLHCMRAFAPTLSYFVKEFVFVRGPCGGVGLYTIVANVYNLNIPGFF